MKLTARRLAEWAAQLASMRPEQLPEGAMRREVWFIRTGLFEEAQEWVRRQPMPGPDEMVKLVPMVVGFERCPRQLRNQIGRPFDMMFTGAEKDGRPSAAIIPDWTLGPRDPSGAIDVSNDEVCKYLVAKSLLIRRFAMQRLAARPLVDLDVIEPTGREAKQNPEIPRVLIVRWRKTDPRDRAPNENPEPVPWSHRWIVRAYLSERPKGSGNLVPVREHVKGPDDKPLVLKSTVDALVK